MTSQSINRRDFFRGAQKSRVETVLRPPWVDAAGLAACNSCGDCVADCPEEILKFDKDGLPYVDFTSTGCTFCGLCAAACKEGVFGDTEKPGWEANRIAVSDGCLLASGVTCQLCTDFCDHEALTFDMSKRPVGALRIDAELCVACGSCVGACPVNAISVVPKVTEVTT